MIAHRFTWVPLLVAGTVLAISPAAQAATKTFTIVQGVASYTDRDIFDAWTGKTSDIKGTLSYDDQSGELLKGEVQVGLATIDSGNGVRDARMRAEFLQTDKFPTASFSVERLEGFPKFSEWRLWGLKQTGRIVGQLTIRGITRPVSFDAVAVFLGNELQITAKSQIKMSDYGISPPSIVFVTVEDGIGLQVQAVAKPSP